MRKNRLIVPLVIAIMAWFGATSAWAHEHGSGAAEPIMSDMKLTLDGKKLQLDEAYLVDSSLFVPYRAFAEGIGGRVEYEEAAQTVSVTKNGNSIKLKIGSSDALVNGVQVKMVGPAQLIHDSTFVHSRFLAEVFGISVQYDDSTRSVNLVSGSNPGVQVFGVTDGETYATDSVTVATAVSNLQLFDFREHTAQEAGEGHVHLWLDSDPGDPGSAYKQINTEPVVFDHLAPGEHTLTVMLEDNVHQPLSPEVKKVIRFTTTAPSAVKTYYIDISGFKFQNEELTVEAGSQIIFTNKDKVKHSAVADNGSFATPLLSEGETAAITLQEPGEYTYFCQPHKAFMKGKIIVK